LPPGELVLKRLSRLTFGAIISQFPRPPKEDHVLGRKKVLLTALVTAAALLSAPATAAVAKAPSATTDQIAGAVSRIAAHKQTAADLELVRSRPEIARQVPDPAGPAFLLNTDGFEPATGKESPAGTGAVVIQVENCAGAIEVGLQQKSLLGNIIWQWWHHIEACSDNVNVTRFLVRRDFLRIADGTVEFLELAQDVQGATPRAWTTSTVQRHLKQCSIAPIPCVNIYPWITVTLYANHTYSWTWG
jgi:hypothetical protein